VSSVSIRGVREVPKGTPSVLAGNYLKAILHQAEAGRTVISARLAEVLGVSPPAVSKALKRLIKRGYVRMDARKTITLTDSGLCLARDLVRRHRLVERLLTDVLGMEWTRVHEEAEKIEHAISPEVEARLLTLLGRQGSCPHGSPILSGEVVGRPRLKRRSLLDAPPQTPLRVVEVDDQERRFLEYLDGLGVRPGTRFVIRERAFDDTFLLETGGRRVHLDRGSAERIWVQAAGKDDPPERPAAGPRPRGGEGQAPFMPASYRRPARLLREEASRRRSPRTPRTGR